MWSVWGCAASWARAPAASQAGLPPARCQNPSRPQNSPWLFLLLPSQQPWHILAAHSIGPWPLPLASVARPPGKSLSQEGTLPYQGRGRQQDAAGGVAEMLVSWLFLKEDKPKAKDTGTTAEVGRRAVCWPCAKEKGKGRFVRDSPSTVCLPWAPQRSQGAGTSTAGSHRTPQGSRVSGGSLCQQLRCDLRHHRPERRPCH